MAKFTLDLNDFPGLKKLIKGQKTTLKFKGIVLNKDKNSIVVDTSDFDMEWEKLSTQEILLASLNESLNKQNVVTL